MTAPELLRRAAGLLEQGQGGEARELLGGVLADLSRPAPVVSLAPSCFREALEVFRGHAREIYAEAEASPVWRGGEVRTLGRLLEVAERVTELCPREPVGVNAEADALRRALLEQLGELERNADAGRLGVLGVYVGNLRRAAPRLRMLLEGLPASACPHGDAARLAELARGLASGFQACWPLADGSARLAALTAPEAPHAPQVVTVPAVRVLLEPDPPLAWEGRAELRGTWYGGGAWNWERTPSETDPLEGLGWEVRRGSGRGTVPELLPVRFPLALRRPDLPSWRGWVPAHAEGESGPLF